MTKSSFLPESLKRPRNKRPHAWTAHWFSHTMAISTADFWDSKSWGSFSSPAIKQVPSWREQHGEGLSPQHGFSPPSGSLASSRLFHPCSDKLDNSWGSLAWVWFITSSGPHNSGKWWSLFLTKNMTIDAGEEMPGPGWCSHAPWGCVAPPQRLSLSCSKP